MNKNKGFIGIAILGIAAVIIAIGSFLAYKTIEQDKSATQSFGAYNPTGGQTYRLQSSINITQSTITLTSFKEPISNIKYTMTYLNSSIEYATIDPQNNTSKEFVSFTGITQNADNTATLTGVIRGLGFSYPYTASTTLAQAHSGQSILILSNPPQLTNQYLNKNNNELVSGFDTFTDPPYFTNAATTTNQAASVAYVNSVVAAGCANSSETVNGCGQLSTGLQTASSTSLGSTGARLILPGSLATSTRGNSTGVGNIVAVKNDGRIDPSFLDGTGSGNQYTFNATTTMSSAVIATTTITSLNATAATTSSLYANNITYIGKLTGNIFPNRYTFATSTAIAVTGTAFATSTLMGIPAGVMTASSTISSNITFSCNDPSGTTNSCSVYLVDDLGDPFISFSISGNSSVVAYQCSAIFQIQSSNNSVSSQITTVGGSCITVAGYARNINVVSTSAINLANARSIGVKIQSATNENPTLTGFSIVANP